MNDKPMITKGEMVKLIILMNLARFLVWVQNTLFRAIEAIAKWWDRMKEKNGWVSFWNELGLPFMLLVILVISLYVANGCSWTLPHYG